MGAAAPPPEMEPTDMLDVVLYRTDDRGRVDLEERIFVSLDELGRFFASGPGHIWEWAEVTPILPCGSGVVGETIRYSVEQLRAIGLGLPLGPGPIEN